MLLFFLFDNSQLLALILNCFVLGFLSLFRMSDGLCLYFGIEVCVNIQ